MPGPWDKYAQSQPQTDAAGPWAKYGGQSAPPPASQPAPAPDQGPNYWERLTNPVGSGAHEQGLFGGALQVGGQAIKTMAQPFIHPVDTAKSLYHTYADPLPNSDLLHTEGAKGDLKTLSPPTADFVSSLKKDPALTLENAAGSGLGMFEGGRIAGGVGEAVPKAANYLHPTPSPAIVPPVEMAARKLSAAVLPAGKDAPGFIRAAQDEVPNVLDYAKRTSNPMKTQLEFSKAAQGNAQEARDFYQNKVLGPNDKLVKTTGSGFGERKLEGPGTFAHLSDIDRRVVDINKQLDAPALNVDDARRALASKSDLQNEAARLREILHSHLSQATGIPPEEIANLRQRVGRSHELANDTDAAVTQRMQSEGKSDQGPLHLSQIPMRVFDAVTGGPMGRADRAFQRSVAKFPGDAKPLPTINAPAPQEVPPLRPSLAKSAGIEAEPNPMRPVPMDPEESRGIVTARNRSLYRRGDAIDEFMDKARSDKAAQTQRQEGLLAKARQQQQALRKKGGNQ